MERKNVLREIDFHIDALIDQLARYEKHVIKTETLWNRINRSVDIDTNNEDSQYCAETGLRALMQSRLNAHGFFSIRRGMFVNVEDCQNALYLTEVINNHENDIELRQAAKRKLDGQLTFLTNGANLEVLIPKCEEEFLEQLRADAV